MGCGSSSVGHSEISTQPGTNNNDKLTEKKDTLSAANSPAKNAKDNKVTPSAGDSIIQSSPPKPVPKSIAFDIVLDNNKAIDNIISKHPPRRLQRLEPLSDVPRMSADLLAEKQRLAEEKRQKQLEKKRQKTRKTSKRHKRLLEARHFEQQQLEQQTVQELEDKQRAAERNKEIKQKELEEKKRLREERARKVRERALKLKQQQEEDLNLDMEKDETYNGDGGKKEGDADSWLGDNATSDYQSDLGERIYSGHESPVKPYKPRSSAEMHARGSAFSASTTDSFDYAFQRTPQTATVSSNNDVYHSESKTDDFFDDDPDDLRNKK